MIELVRFGFTAQGTFGFLTVDDLQLFTVERPWRDNRRFESSVPTGTYSLEPHNGTKYRDTWALVGKTVAHWPGESRKQRYTILLHAANKASQLQGCIAPGLRMAYLGTIPAVTSSRVAMTRLRKVLRAKPVNALQLRIRNDPELGRLL